MLLNRLLISVSTALLLGSCANKDESRASYEPARKKTIASFSEGYKVGQAEDGSPAMVSDRRSMYEGKTNSPSAVGRDYSGKDFRTKQYRAERWGGSKSVDRKSYQGVKELDDANKSPWYVSKTAQASGVASRWDGNRYSTSSLNKKTAYETSKDQVSTSTYYDTKKSGHMRPRIFGYKEQPGMTINDSKDLLGR